MTNPAAYEPGTPTVDLGGQKWPVPTLALLQNRKLQPLFARVAGKVFNGVLLVDLTEPDVDDLVEIVRLGLSRAHPTITREEMDEMPIGVADLVGAFLVIVEQSRLFKKAAAPGEAEGVPATPQTGT